MRFLSASLVALLLPAVGLAQTVELDVYEDVDGEPIPLVGPVEGTYTETFGVKAASVVYDPTGEEGAGEYVMYFEARLANDDVTELFDSEMYEGCQLPNGNYIVWVIGRATSPDGVTGWVIDPEPVLLPEAGSYYGCHAAQPAVIRDDEGLWHMWFKGQQAFGPCPDDAEQSPWGCIPATGFGYATSADGVSWSVSDEPMLTTDDLNAVDGVTGSAGSFGFPRVIFDEDTWHLWYTLVPNIYRATSAAPGEGWVVEPSPAIGPEGFGWRSDRVFNPAMACEENVSLSSPYAYTMFFGGKSSQAAEESGLGMALSFEGENWVFPAGNPLRVWESNDTRWDPWDVVKVESDYLLYFTKAADPLVDAPVGPWKIGFAATTDMWDDADVGNKMCNVPATPGETETPPEETETPPEETETPPEETETPPEETETSPTDTGIDDLGPRVRGGCGCASVPAGSPAMLLPLLPAIGLLRRRRRG